jgi:formate hydrogenlyase subunit 3/multisubunit Na+/H+ antiporter MnhD subunit
MTPGLTDLQSMYGPLVAVAIGFPLVLAVAVLHRRLRSAALRLAPWAALPAFVLVTHTNPVPALELPWLLLGTRLGIDTTAQVFLFFTALLWTCAGVYARAYLAQDAARHQFFAFFLVTMSGNLGLILAQDMVSFYLFFALMSFAAYGLVVHEGSAEAYRAGRIYIGLVMIGEVLLVSALLLIVPATGNASLPELPVRVAAASARDLIIGLTFAGFGIKAGALPLHVWLPLAHPVAPTPASAVLSGAMIKAGLLGWLRFLPLGEIATLGWGNVCTIAGLAAAFYGVLVGCTQDNAKTALAYSSISQMGFMTMAVGVGLTAPTVWPQALTATALYALHHALAKGTLFLGVGVAKEARGSAWIRQGIGIGLLLPALALAGAPFTSGAFAKLALKTATAQLPAPWPAWLGWLLPLAAIGTTLLMGRFLWLAWPRSTVHGSQLTPGLWVPWAVVVIGVTVTTWLFAVRDPDIMLKTLPSASWPVLVGVLVVWVTWQWSHTAATPIGLNIPAGDLLVGAEWLAHCLRHTILLSAARSMTTQRRARASPWRGCRGGGRIGVALLQMEGRLGRWTSAGVLFLLLAAMFFAVFVVTRAKG